MIWSGEDGNSKASGRKLKSIKTNFVKKLTKTENHSKNLTFDEDFKVFFDFFEDFNHKKIIRIQVDLNPD